MRAKSRNYRVHKSNMYSQIQCNLSSKNTTKLFKTRNDLTLMPLKKKFIYFYVNHKYFNLNSSKKDVLESI